MPIKDPIKRAEYQHQRWLRYKATRTEEDIAKKKQWRHENHERNKELDNAKNKERYAKNKDLWRPTRQKYQREWSKQRRSFTADITLVEGYELTLKHPELNWDVHHKLEDQGFTRQQLIDAGMYWNRPPQELVWMTRSAHKLRHFAHKNKFVEP